MGIVWRPKTTSTSSSSSNADASKMNSNTSSSKSKASRSDSTKVECSCVFRLVRKLKKQGRILRNRATITSITPSRQSSFQCRYDPLSYSLNFDDSTLNPYLHQHHNHSHLSSRFVSHPLPATAATAAAAATTPFGPILIVPPTPT
ncbi:hypothetical protein NMG60_11015231 [Bertholletia excelsa]